MTATAPRKPADDLRQFSLWFDRGVTHFLRSIHTPERMASEYPTRDTHDEQQETDFIAGFEHARQQHEVAKVGDRIELAGHFGWRADHA